MNTNDIISKHMSELGKKSHKKNPRPREFYVEMGKKSAEARRKKKHEN